MNLIDSALHLARRFPGGIEALALRMGKRATTMRHELASSDHYKLGLADAEVITLFAVEQRVSNPLAILNTFAATCGAVVVMLPDMPDESCGTFRGLAESAREFSDFVATVADAAADGVVTANELAAVDRELSELVGRVQSVRAGLAAMHEASKPRQATAGAARGLGLPEVMS